jgi:hypothetical protein
MFRGKGAAMDNDAVRTSGDTTLVDMWIGGKSRTVSVTKAAIEAHLRLSPERAEQMSADDRCEFVRANLRLLAATATDIVCQGDPNVTAVVIDAGHLGGQAPKADRRQGGDRRRGGDRRKAKLGPPPTGERRRGDRAQRD